MHCLDEKRYSGCQKNDGLGRMASYPIQLTDMRSRRTLVTSRTIRTDRSTSTSKTRLLVVTKSPTGFPLRQARLSLCCASLAARVRAERLVGAAGSSDGGTGNDDKCDDVCSVAGGSHRPTARLVVP
jgi:hypothetical protein